MQTLLTNDLWDEIAKRSRKAKRHYCAIAYVTDTSRLHLKREDVLIADASPAAIQAGETSVTALRSCVKAGVQVFSVTGLHAKAHVFDTIAIIGSANASARSRRYLTEAAILTDDLPVVANAKRFILELAEQALPVDDSLLKQLAALPVRKRPVLSGRTSKPKISTPGRTTWLVGVRELRHDAYADEEGYVDEGEVAARENIVSRRSDVSWIRWTGADSIRRLGRPGDTIIQIWRPMHKHRAPRVYEATPVLYRQDVGHWTRFYLEQPVTTERRALPWATFKRLSNKCGLTRVGPNSLRPLTTREASKVADFWPDFVRDVKD